MKYKTCHMARHINSIGNFTPTYGEIEADSEQQALNIARTQLCEANVIFTTGYADILSVTFNELVGRANHYLATQLLYVKRCFGGHSKISIVTHHTETNYYGTMRELAEHGHIPSGLEWMDRFLPSIPPVSKVPADDVTLHLKKYDDGGPECPWDTAKQEQEEAKARAKVSRAERVDTNMESCIRIGFDNEWKEYYIEAFSSNSTHLGTVRFSTWDNLLGFMSKPRMVSGWLKDIGSGEITNQEAQEEVKMWNI